MSPHQSQGHRKSAAPEGPAYQHGHVFSTATGPGHHGNPLAWNYASMNSVIQPQYSPYYQNITYSQHIPPYGNLAAAQDPSVLCYSCGTHPGNAIQPLPYYPPQFVGMPEYYHPMYPPQPHGIPAAPPHFVPHGPSPAVPPPLEYRRNSCSSAASIAAPQTPSMSSTCVESSLSIVGDNSQGLPLSPCTERYLTSEFPVVKHDKQLHSRYGPIAQNSPHTKNSLYNPSNTTNVYIRGLAPDTDDEKLLRLVQEYGNVESHKAIIDKGTGFCKGYGFARFESLEEAKACILGMAKVNLDAGFARESFNSRLKALGDPASTNLYVSNLPATVDEAQLTKIFEGYQTMSVRILRDAQGVSRGVGFVRFANHEVCDEVIEKFNDQEVLEGKAAIQVRYADTYAQKTLKEATTRVREFYCNQQKRALAATSPTMSTNIPTGPKFTGGRKWGAGAGPFPRIPKSASERKISPVNSGLSKFQSPNVHMDSSASDNGSTVTAIPSAVAAN